MAFILHKKTILMFLAFFLIFAIITSCAKIILAGSPKAKYTIVIDAGHGGIDGGSVGKNGSIEAELNLEYAKTLKTMMSDFGFNVVMTRENENGLYSPLAKNKKKDDMKKRKEIIEKSNADFVISIHMNSYTSYSHGAQVFYGAGDETSKALAQKIQDYFIKNLVSARQEIKVGDYYILNAIKAPSVLVECGFLSNPAEEKLLASDEYKKEVCYNILLGVLSFFS
ncbi:MAG: N-acetylmuramoyl-L-alanine amidase [Clostridia bacterium]|nr:N-acetylmuramoyl-L-alanine amidase [Clostridia bacterium]